MLADCPARIQAVPVRHSPPFAAALGTLLDCLRLHACPCLGGIAAPSAEKLICGRIPGVLLNLSGLEKISCSIEHRAGGSTAGSTMLTCSA